MMKYLPLILHNISRNKIRSLLTSLSIAMSLFLVVTLSSLLSSQDEITERTKVHNRVAVLHEAGLAGRLPIAYVDRIRKIPGVACASPMSWFGGNYREEKTQFPQFGADARTIFDVYEEYQIPAEQLADWQRDKTGCVVGSLIARNKGWKIGDKIPLKGNIYPVDLELTVRGIYDGDSTVDKEWLLFHFEYMDEALKEHYERIAGNAGIIMLRVESQQKVPTVMQTIESAFASSDAPVKPMTEKQFAQSFTEMMGNVRGFIRYTSIAVVVALLCVAANTMAMSLRERTREIALLKAIGFSQSSVLGMFLSESVLIGLLGGVVGALGGKLLFAAVDLSKILPGLGMFYIPWTTALYGLALAAGIGLFSGLAPAWRAANLSVLEGLRKVV
ncbi:MAG: ABC transporter permease [Pirellulales bacterium]|nr:ABC transporter permease [Pirellulales bacterium]